VSDSTTDVDQLRKHGWRQGSVLPPALLEAARDAAARHHPNPIEVDPADWLLVTSHTCDVRNRGKLENEPTVELLVARVHPGKPDSREVHGKNSRRLHFEGEQAGALVRLSASIHDRIRIARQLLGQQPPDANRVIGHPTRGHPDPTIEMLATWVAKRYQRQAFPDEFDTAVQAAHAKEPIDRFLIAKASILLGVFIAVADRSDQTPRFHVDFRLVVKMGTVEADWQVQKARLEEEFEALWTSVTQVEVEVIAMTASEMTLHEIHALRLKKFDRDWISYEHDPESGPAPEG
jgi:hypothetical protein